MKSLFLALALVCGLYPLAKAYSEEAPIAESRFFANVTTQRQSPEAFILQPESEPFLLQLENETKNAKQGLTQAIKNNAELYNAIQNWTKLSIDEQIPFLRKVFAIEVNVLGIQAPELIIDDRLPGQAAFFDFDINNPGPGKVILNPKELATMDKYASLALLLHETRHSAQFQQAFLSGDLSSPSSRAYRAAFKAQKELPIRSFCDFLTLANEHEAFEFGNFVLGSLTKWTVDMPDMGTYASQYDQQGKIKLDLSLLLKTDPTKTLLEKFNEAEKAQCQLLGACPP